MHACMRQGTRQPITTRSSERQHSPSNTTHGTNRRLHLSRTLSVPVHVSIGSRLYFLQERTAQYIQPGLGHAPIRSRGEICDAATELETAATTPSVGPIAFVRGTSRRFFAAWPSCTTGFRPMVAIACHRRVARAHSGSVPRNRSAVPYSSLIKKRVRVSRTSRRERFRFVQGDGVADAYVVM
jgi:hypothetical protein